MNDLAEKALAGLDAARRQVRDHPMTACGVGGFALAATIVVAGADATSGRAGRPLTAWLGLEDAHALAGPQALSATLLLIALVLLLVLWLFMVELVRRHGKPPTQVWRVALAWAVPFAVGPPFMDTAVYGNVAFGLVQRAGHDPYSTAATRLGDTPIVAAIEPAARDLPSVAAPLGSLIEHLSVSASGGSALGGVLVLRTVAVMAVVAIGRLAARLGGTHRDRALTLSVLNPLVLLYFVSGAHLDAVMTAGLLAALLAARRRRWLPAVVLVCVAGSVSAPAFVALPILIVAHCAAARAPRPWLVAGRDVAIAAIVTVGLASAVAGRSGFGWVTNVDGQFASHTPFSAAGGVSAILTPIVRVASYDDLAIGGRITALTALACVLCYLITTAGHRPLERSTGFALLALALLGPVLRPWYLLWGLLCLAPTAAGERRIAVLALSAAGCVLVPPGFGRVTAYVLTAVLLAGIGASVVVLFEAQRRALAEKP